MKNINSIEEFVAEFNKKNKGVLTINDEVSIFCKFITIEEIFLILYKDGETQAGIILSNLNSLWFSAGAEGFISWVAD